jgi:16S rRNA processing protein RimM
LSYSDDPTRLETVGRVVLSKGGQSPRGMRVIGYKDRFVLLELEGIDGRDQAEALRGALVHVLKEDLPPLENGELYVHEVVGLVACTPDGEVLGKVIEVLSPPGHDLYVVERDGKRVMIPAVEGIVRAVDIQTGRMVVDLPPGLLEVCVSCLG